MRKGHIVRLRENGPFGEPRLWRRLTEDEVEAWREEKRRAIEAATAAGKDTFHLAFDSAGEPRLPPKDVGRRPNEGEIFRVARARVQAPLGYGWARGCVLLMDTTGVEWYTYREMVDFAEKVDPIPETEVGTVETWDEARALTLTKDDVRAGIAAWLVRVNDVRRKRKTARFGEDFVARHHHDVVVKGGRKWIKTVAGTTVFCFIEATTGDIYKAASYTAPATNFPRGNVFVEDVTEAEKRGGHYA